ncbi:hypothetical protein NDU88_003901 [Pleurodeles waltl]|uniref:Uncharacterized protein n=1 Tax=Pleurodeles waltl TaxID=8319 RepID=A0AAV7UZS6_PLEWA|nr:hypothetical protein NDU88_003901 [Pleurodeles waltl]
MDKHQSCLSFEAKSAHKPARGTSPGSEQEDLVQEHISLEAMLLAMQHSLQSFNSKIDTLNVRMDQMAKKLDQHGTRIAEAEQRISTTEDILQSMRETCLNMEKVIVFIQVKNEDLKARSIRNNICLLGVPETTNTGETETFVEQLLRAAFGVEHFSNMLVVQRCHRTLEGRPPPIHLPRLIVTRLLNCRDRDMVLRLSRNHTTVQYQGNEIAFYPGFTQAV